MVSIDLLKVYLNLVIGFGWVIHYATLNHKAVLIINKQWIQLLFVMSLIVTDMVNCTESLTAYYCGFIFYTLFVYNVHICS